MNDRARKMRLAELYGWYVYAANETGDEYCKVGTASRPQYRIEQLRNGNPRPLTILATWHVAQRDQALRIESATLVRLGHLRLPGRDWLRCSVSELIQHVRYAISELNIHAIEVPE